MQSNNSNNNNNNNNNPKKQQKQGTWDFIPKQKCQTSYE